MTSFDELKYFTNVTRLPVAEGAPYNGTGVFSGCAKLESIDLTNITAIGLACFRNCTSLKSVKNTQNLTSISIDNYADWAFLNCTSLEYIDLSNVTVIDSRAFIGCSKLANVESLQNL
ncbi:leucine-rich repeat protein [Segatella bryantii]|uniref:leucine-rich repeat protein n=1 Tax=Segatella bryantii TaxID=77095 RepID=UPI003C6FD9A2